jgi:hypothetical protein
VRLEGNSNGSLLRRNTRTKNLWIIKQPHGPLSEIKIQYIPISSEVTLIKYYKIKHLQAEGSQIRADVLNFLVTDIFLLNLRTTSNWNESTTTANSRSVSQEVSRLLWNPKVHYRVHHSPPLVSNLTKVNPIHALPPYFFKIHSNKLLSMRNSSKRSLPSGLQISCMSFFPCSLTGENCSLLLKNSSQK